MNNTSKLANGEKTRTQSSRNTNIDLAKLISAVGVISAHIPPSPGSNDLFGLLTPFRVPFFFLISLVYFTMSLNHSKPLEVTLKKIAKRLIVPYLAWTFLYISLIFVNYAIKNAPGNLDFINALLYGSSAVQMYFLPQLLGMQLIVLGIFLLFKNNLKGRIFGVSMLWVAFLYFSYGNANHIFGVISYQALISYVLSAYVISKILQHDTRKDLLILISLLILFLTFYWMLTNSPYLALYPLGGIGLTLLLLNLKPIRLHGAAMYVASLSFGIYLSHEIFIQIFLILSKYVLHWKTEYSGFPKLMFTLSVLFFSSLLIMAMSKIEWVRKLFLGS